MLTKAQVDQLRAAYVAGETQARAAALAKTCTATAWRYFNRFADAGIAREAVRRRTRWTDPLPRYGGPAWIGKRISQ